MNDEEEIKRIAQNVYNQNQISDKFSVSQTAFHRHNGTDSPKVKQGDIIPGTTSAVHLGSNATEVFTLDTTQNITLIALKGVATNGLGQKALLNGNAQLGNCFMYGVGALVGSNVRTIGTYEPFLQVCNAAYIDTLVDISDPLNPVTNNRVMAKGSYIVYVLDDTAALVASMQIIDWTGTSIRFETYLAANWSIDFFLTMS